MGFSDQSARQQSCVAMSVLPPEADMVQGDHDVRYVPKADMAATSALR